LQQTVRGVASHVALYEIKRTLTTLHKEYPHESAFDHN